MAQKINKATGEVNEAIETRPGDLGLVIGQAGENRVKQLVAEGFEVSGAFIQLQDGQDFTAEYVGRGAPMIMDSEDGKGPKELPTVTFRAPTGGDFRMIAGAQLAAKLGPQHEGKLVYICRNGQIDIGKGRRVTDWLVMVKGGMGRNHAQPATSQNGARV